MQERDSGDGGREHLDIKEWSTDVIGACGINLGERTMSLFYGDTGESKVVFQELEGIQEGVFPAVSVAGCSFVFKFAEADCKRHVAAARRGSMMQCEELRCYARSGSGAGG